MRSTRIRKFVKLYRKFTANGPQIVYCLPVHWEICARLYFHGCYALPSPFELHSDTFQFSFRFVGTRLSAAIRLDYLRALFKQSISELDKLPSGSAAQTITGGANTLQIGITDKLGTLLQFSAMILSAFIVAFKYSWQLTLVTSSVLLGIIVLFGFVIPVWLKSQKAVDYANGKATSIASEAIGAVRMIVACGAEGRVAKKHNYWVGEARRRGLRQSPLLGAQLGPTFLCVFADYALTFWYGVKLYNDGHIDSVGTILM